ncbi:MAG TPA: hypothetical protein VHO84_14490, partial [Syntrophorhabdaceae bacterium]|nr:hypothetical protein [Syntrophorhabdaceae bacterium]
SLNSRGHVEYAAGNFLQLGSLAQICKQRVPVYHNGVNQARPAPRGRYAAIKNFVVSSSGTSYNIGTDKVTCKMTKWILRQSYTC